MGDEPQSTLLQPPPAKLRGPFAALFQVCVYFIASLEPHTLGVCHIHQTAAAKRVFRIKTSPASSRPVYSTGNTHRELGRVPAAHCSSSARVCELFSRISLRWKMPPGSGTCPGDGASWRWGKKPQESSLGRCVMGIS